MERLNCLRCAYRNGDNGDCTATGGSFTTVPAAHCRLLQKYLDTGLTPEECQDVKAIIKYAFAGGKSKVERVRELLRAHREGRVVVLPCKVGDTVWTYCDYPAKKVYQSAVTDISTLNGRTMLNTSQCGVVDARDIGKTVFLTREEAEETLGGAEK